MCYLVRRSQVRGQTADSLREHDPDVCMDIPETWPSAECPYPVFEGTRPVVSHIPEVINK